MRLVETIVKRLNEYIQDKKILEIACGDSDFSLCLAKHAKEVVATDISLDRFKRRCIESIPSNIVFREMDATNLEIESNSIDVSVCYNALGHLCTILNSILVQVRRVTIDNGYIIFIATWKMDRRIIPELKNIIYAQSELMIHEDIEKENYHILIVKKVRKEPT